MRRAVQQAPEADDEQLLLVHSAAHLAQGRALCNKAEEMQAAPFPWPRGAASGSARWREKALGPLSIEAMR